MKRLLLGWSVTFALVAGLAWGSPMPRPHDPTLSDWSIAPVLLAGELTLAQRGSGAARRGAFTVLGTAAVCEGLKSIIHERRPDGSDNRSFPSEHAALAFAIAAMVAHEKPSIRGEAFIAAGWCASSRVQVRRHRWRDVVAGAAIGLLAAKAMR